MEKYRRINGSADPKAVEKINGAIPVWAVRWDIRQPEGTHGSGLYGTNYMEAQVWRKPTMDEIRALVFGWMNEEVDRKILSGFTWGDMQVWLSTENQFNYKAAFDLAVQTEGATLPVTFKFGTTEEPGYHEFRTLEELQQFYVSCIEYVTTCLKEGWAAKDTFDFAPYEECLGGNEGMEE